MGQCQHDQQLLAATEKLWRVGQYKKKISLLYRIQCTFSFQKSTKVVLSMQGAWHSPQTLPTKVHNQTSDDLHSPPRDMLSSSGFKPWEPSPLSSKFKTENTKTGCKVIIIGQSCQVCSKFCFIEDFDIEEKMTWHCRYEMFVFAGIKMMLVLCFY